MLPFKDSNEIQFVPHGEHSFPNKETDRLKMLREIVAVLSWNGTEHTSPCGGRICRFY
jgi:hypothetical protein